MAQQEAGKVWRLAMTCLTGRMRTSGVLRTSSIVHTVQVHTGRQGPWLTHLAQWELFQATSRFIHPRVRRPPAPSRLSPVTLEPGVAPKKG